MVTYCPLEPIKAVTAIYLLSPQIPMLFMGEEWGAREPFPYFCDFDEELNEKVRMGRRVELSRLPGFDADELLDPTAQSTFAMAKLDWSQLHGAEAAEMLAFYKSILALRHHRIVPLLNGEDKTHASFHTEGHVTSVEWTLSAGTNLHLLLNLSNQPAKFSTQQAAEQIFSLNSDSKDRLAPWSVIASIRQAEP